MMRNTPLVNFISAMVTVFVGIFIGVMIVFLMYQVAIGVEYVMRNGLKSIIMPLWEGTNAAKTN